MGKLKWLIVTHLGRLALGIILLLTGMFSEGSTMEFLKTGWVIFEYIYPVGALILIGQTLYLIFGGLYHWGKQLKRKWKS